MLCIAELQSTDVAEITEAFRALGWDKPPSLFELYLRECWSGGRAAWIAHDGDSFAGYTTLAWRSSYPEFAERGIPEVQDLNVLPAWRRRGIATQLMNATEALARTRSERCGLAVGLTADYGPAQVLYARRGYVPDARGIAYQDKIINFGERVRADDDLVLHLIKSFA